ncbi:type I pullulanase [Clostridium vincentii]
MYNIVKQRSLISIKLNEIDNLNCYKKEDLGYTFENNMNIFKVWSPLADNISLCIYEDYNKEDKIKYSMQKRDRGVWEIFLKEEVEGKYYTFLSSINNVTKESVDPYARALSVNGEKGAIVNMEKTNPENWQFHSRPTIKNSIDAVIYEVNIRDISSDENSGIKSKGKYLGLVEENTRGPGRTKTGLNHMKDLGITHVQLLPIYDFASVDETVINNTNYNWGYDPANYNTPEGSYSTNPYSPISRIKELKMAIKVIHENGLGVIMDVVYNHIYDVEKSGFHNLMPGYFFRYDKNGELSNESMCGNVIATENAMARKFIVDSVKYWAKEYKLDGFRFDLMGLIDIDTMKEVKEELNKINPSIIVLGEGWDLGDILSYDKKAIQVNANKLKNIAFFNDSIRDGLRGDSFSNDARGFLSFEENKELEVKKAIVGGIYYSEEINTWGEVDPNQVVNYIECHDNHTLYDKLNLTIKDEEKIKYMHRLGTSIILLSQGIPFIHAGQEFLRTKCGIENSYNASDSINKMDWTRKMDNIDTVEYVKGLIELRKQHPEFRMRTAKEIIEHLSFINAPKNCVAYLIKDNLGGKDILVIHNGNENSVGLDFKSNSMWEVLVDKNRAGIDKIRTIKGYVINVEGSSTLVAVMK